MLKFLVPSFIKNIDKTLLLNYPFWYIVKLHYIVYFTALMWIISYGIGCMLPIDISSYNPENVTGMWIFVFSILSIILFCVWMYYLTIYNNEDHFGKFSIWDDTKLLFVLLFGLNLLMSFSYPLQLRVKSRLANSFSDTVLAQQYNTLNLANKYVTSNIENFQYCGYNVHDTVDVAKLKADTNAYGDQRYNYDLSKYKNFTAYSPETDPRFDFDFSVLFFDTPHYTPSNEFNGALLNEWQIEKEYALQKTEADKLNALNSYFAITKLYENQYNSYNKYTPQDYLDNYNHVEKVCSTYFPEAYNPKPEDKIQGGNFYLPTNDVSHFIKNIYDAKFTLPFILSDGYLLFAFYFSFFVSLLVILFRNNKWQHYLVSAVSFILLGIIIGIIALAVGHSSESAFSSLSLLTFITAGVISIIYYFKKDKYNVTGAVATNLFYFCLPIMPFFFCIYAHEVFHWLKCQNPYSNDPYEMAQCIILDRTYKDALCYAQLIGVIVFIIGVMPFYKSFFARQKALPKEK